MGGRRGTPETEVPPLELRGHSARLACPSTAYMAIAEPVLRPNILVSGLSLLSSLRAIDWLSDCQRVSREEYDVGVALGEGFFHF